MKFFNCIATLGLAIALGGCATRGAPPLQEVRAFGAGSARLGAFSELTVHYRDTYKREQPYLLQQADQYERETYARRHAAYDDFINIQKSVALYLQTLGKLAGESQYDLSDQLKMLGSGIKAWPESGLDASHAKAYTRLAQLMAGAATASYQDAAVQAMLRDGDIPLQSLIGAMSTLMRHYEQTHSNEKKIVLGLIEIEIALLDSTSEHLLSALAKAHYQDKAAEYALTGRRFTVAEKDLEALARAHRSLLAQIGERSGTQRDAVPN